MVIRITGGVELRGGYNMQGTTLTFPDAPIIGTATATGTTTATVTYTAPSFDGNSPITSYTAISTPGNITATVSQSVSGTINVTGLNGGTTYTFKVYATNSFGNSQQSAASNSITTDTFTIYGTGYNFNGDLGDGTSQNKSTPVVIYSMSAGSTALSMYNDGRIINETNASGPQIYMWGTNVNGRLATNDTINRSTPQSNLLNGSSWKTVVQSSNNGYGVKTDGTLWAWGLGSRLGNSSQISRSSPIQIGSGTNWDKLYSIAAYSNQVFAIKTDGTMWAWGDNNSEYLLGDGTTINRSSPVQIGAGVSWSFVAPGPICIMALATNGNLYLWGNGSYGRNFLFGVGIVYSVPTLIASNTNYRYITLDGQYNAFALTNDNKFFAWGLNQFNAMVGRQNNVAYSSPVQIMSDKTLSHVLHGGGNYVALTTDNKIFVWGNNNSGELGDGTTTYRSSPVQISATQVGFTLTPTGIFNVAGDSVNYFVYKKIKN